MINNAMAALSREDASQPNTPLRLRRHEPGYIGYDLQNALREELYNREICDIPVATMITQVRWTRMIPHLKIPETHRPFHDRRAGESRGGTIWVYMQERRAGYRRVVASPKPRRDRRDRRHPLLRILASWSSPAEAAESVTRQGQPLKGAPGAVIDKDFAKRTAGRGAATPTS